MAIIRRTSWFSWPLRGVDRLLRVHRRRSWIRRRPGRGRGRRGAGLAALRTNQRV